MDPVDGKDRDEQMSKNSRARNLAEEAAEYLRDADCNPEIAEVRRQESEALHALSKAVSRLAEQMESLIED